MERAFTLRGFRRFASSGLNRPVRAGRPVASSVFAGWLSESSSFCPRSSSGLSSSNTRAPLIVCAEFDQ